MNLSELKQDFYKRYEASDNFLHFTSNGLLCTLLGHSEVEYAPALSCTLSMGIKMFSRRLGGDIINIQNIASDKGLSYIFGTNPNQFHRDDRERIQLIQRLERYDLNGAQVLFECSIPTFLAHKEVFSVTLVQSLMKTTGIEADELETAALAAGGDNVNICLGITASRKGYCTLVASGIPKNLPLPLSGYKILSSHCTEEEPQRSKAIKYAFEHIRRIYPHVGTISDITIEMLQDAKRHIKSKNALRYMYHLVNENLRINAAAEALKKCQTGELFNQMKISQASIEHFWDIGNEHRFLAKCFAETEGIAAFRSWKNGVAAIVEEDAIDNAITLIRDEFECNIGYQPTFCVSDVF